MGGRFWRFWAGPGRVDSKGMIVDVAKTKELREIGVAPEIAGSAPKKPLREVRMSVASCRRLPSDREEMRCSRRARRKAFTVGKFRWWSEPVARGASSPSRFFSREARAKGPVVKAEAVKIASVLPTAAGAGLSAFPRYRFTHPHWGLCWTQKTMKPCRECINE
jgi:hypothetical protein